MTKKLAFVMVKWNDAWGDDDNFQTLHGIRTTHEPMPVETYGYLCQNDEIGVSVANEASTQDGQDVFRGRTFIPRAMIIEVIELKLTKKKDRKPKSSTEMVQNSNGLSEGDRLSDQ